MCFLLIPPCEIQRIFLNFRAEWFCCTVMLMYISALGMFKNSYESVFFALIPYDFQF